MDTSNENTGNGNEQNVGNQQQPGPTKTQAAQLPGAVVDATPGAVNETVSKSADAPKAKPGVYFVKDTNAKPNKVRQHKIITAMHMADDGATVVIDDFQLYNLSSSIPCEMPEAHALQFLKDESFIVTDSNGVRIKPVIKKDTDVGKIVLEDDELIAKYDELTQESLYKRCKIIPGTEHIKKNTRKGDLIEHLMSHEAKRKNVGQSRGSEDSLPENTNIADSLLDTSGGNVVNEVSPGSIVQPKNKANQSAMAQVTS